MNSPAVRRIAPPLLRTAGAAAVLIAVLVKIGGGPFLRGLHAVTVPALAFALAVTALTTLCSAWRWSLVARGLGAELPLATAIPAYYRSQFLNSILPGGVVGDVQRAVVHGRQAGDLSRGLRAVAWERLSGQCVQLVLAVLVLLVFPSPVRPLLPFVLAGVAGAALACVAAGRGLRRYDRPGALLRVAGTDLRSGVLAHRAGISLASAGVTIGHGAVFVVAARTVGTTASYAQLIPLAMLAQLAMSVPLTLGGWGPREGICAWAFAAAGLGAGSGVAVTTGYGVLALVATLPGAGLLARDLVGRFRSEPDPAPVRPVERAVHG